jgi:hypothetical protein
MGYGSDGELGSFFDAVADEVPWDDYDEQPPEPIKEQPQDNIAAAPAVAPPQLSETDVRGMKIAKLKIAKLKKELKSRPQPVNGVKDVLVQRLLACCHLTPSNDVAIGTVANNNQPVELLHHGVRWRPLEPDSAPMEEPCRMHSLVAPTTHAAGATTEAKKYNYSEMFDRELFMTTGETWVRNNNGWLKQVHPSTRGSSLSPQQTQSITLG